MKTYTETLYDSYGQEFAVDKVYFENKTEHQHLIIFENARFGRVMALDGIIQTTQADEFIYHEMLTHVPILAHGNVKDVMIVGGGDDGMLREVCKHSSVERIVEVEIDGQVLHSKRQGRLKFEGQNLSNFFCIFKGDVQRSERNRLGGYGGHANGACNVHSIADRFKGPVNLIVGILLFFKLLVSVSK